MDRVSASVLLMPTEGDRLLSNDPTTAEQLKECCKPAYQMRRLKSKGAILILILSYLVTGVFIYLYSYARHGDKLRLIVLGLSLPFAGWLADVLISRYKMIYCSIWLMWVTSLSTAASSVVQQFAQSGTLTSKILYYTDTVLMVSMSLGFGGYQANVMQFSLDQLQDASTSEIKSFITWYVWSVVSSGMIVHLAVICTPETYHIFRLIIICVSLSIALILVSLCGHWLVKEPVTQNPFKLVYRVIRYARMTKHPRCRSAFTYCGENLPSRFDFGKSKYGGPFSTEQVEDVKTFLRLLPVLLVGCAIGGLVIANNGIEWYQLKMLVRFPNKYYQRKECYSETLFTQIFYYSTAIIIPLYEFLLYPTFNKCFSRIKLHWKFVVGVISQVAKFTSLVLIQVAARYNYLHVNSGHNATNIVECMFYGNRSALSSSLDYRWTAIPTFFHSISLALLFVGGFEFLCAQVPYSMKGLIFGTTYGLGAISITLGLSVSFLFKYKVFTWSTGIISCGFWYFLQVLVIMTVISCVGSVILKWYKYRKREDILPNEHIFAERYFIRDD